MNNSNVTLYDALKSSYGNKQSRDELRRNGYNYDSMLSNHNQQVWYNPNKQKLLFNVAGTHNLSDVGTDVYLALGKLKDTNRYKEASRVLDEAKRKYNVNNATISGHSLGSTIGRYIANKDDKFYGLDGGYTLFQPTRDSGGNQHHYRSKGDVVSLLGANATHMKTLKSKSSPFDILGAHNIDNIKDENIFVD